MFQLKDRQYTGTEVQLGWNCFDIAIHLATEFNIMAAFPEELGIAARKELVRRGLEHSGDIEYRRLLSPEIRHAAALTVSYILEHEEDKDSKEKILQLNELFILHEALDEEDDQLVVEQHIHELLKTDNQPTYSRGLLPDFMRTAELRQVVLEYLNAHEEMKASVDACNNALGFVNNERLSIQGLDDYFLSEENQQLNQEIYVLYMESRDRILSTRERNFSEFCEREETYRSYLNGYYGNNEWVAFQRSFAEEDSTSMVDITAYIINKQIIIYDLMDEVIYSTINSDAIEEIYIQYNGNNHFVSYQPQPSMSSFTHNSDGYVFPEGSLSKSVNIDASPKESLTLQEKSDISESKKLLLIIIEKLNAAKENYRKVLINEDQQASKQTLVYLKTLCKELESSAIEYIQFLSSKASVLLRYRCFSQAATEFKIALNFSRQVVGSNNIETLFIQLDYGICQLSISVELGRDIIENTIKKLKETKGSPNSVKKAIAIANYQLAQYFFAKNNFDKSEELLIESRNLRKEYGASKDELEKIDFLFAKIHSVKGEKSKAESLLMSRYIDLKLQNELNIDLIPIIEELCEIMGEQRNVGEEIRYLSHLLAIKKHISLDERQIISTQLRMLRVMVLVVSEEEYFDVMNEIEESLSGIPVTKEDVTIGLNYLELADARMSTLCPPKWSNVRKREYFAQTMAIIGKAKNHLRINLIANYPLLIINPNGIKEKLDDLSQNCLMSISFFEDPAAVPRLIGQSLHPEDEAEILLTVSTHCVIESNTEKELKALSEFSSEVDYQLFQRTEGILTIEEFEQLPVAGEINPYRLRAAQGGYNLEFRDGKSLLDTEQCLLDNPSYTKNIPPIEIGIYCGKVYSFDTRRLVIHQQAKEKNSKVFIRYKKISGLYLQQRVDAIFSPRSWNGLVTAARYGGKHSESIPYINPLVRKQLEEKVDVEFKRFPSDRKSADPNGFPNIKQKAKKIHSFFQEKAINGSENAKKILKESERVFQSEGKKAAWMFLISQKKDGKPSCAHELKK